MNGENVCVEVCPNCVREVELRWDVKRDGYKAYCPYCGGRLMMCNDCKHGHNSNDCNYDSRTDTCKHNRQADKSKDYKTKSEELTINCIKLMREIDQFKRDNEQLRQVCAILLDGHPAIVLREEELARAPKIELFANMSGEAVIRVRR